jgi:hypothetical protein
VLLLKLDYRNAPNKKSSPIVIAAEITSEPRHPSRFEKKKNIKALCNSRLAEVSKPEPILERHRVRRDYPATLKQRNSFYLAGISSLGWLR